MTEAHLHLGSTIRAQTAECSLARAYKIGKKIGITRVANITGLDKINIPVALAIRPTGKHLSVSQGKGCSLALAKISAMMESIELWHVENLPPPSINASFATLKNTKINAIDPTTLSTGLYQPSILNTRSLDWHTGVDLVTNDPILLPKSAISLDATKDCSLASLLLGASSNGLASGNTHCEALCHALFELIERNSFYHWQTLSLAKQEKSSLSLNSIESGVAQQLLTCFYQANIRVRIFDASSAHQIPVFICIVRDTEILQGANQFMGKGAHFNKEIAIIRSITEAAQVRLTYISGSRDDVFPGFYKKRVLAQPALKKGHKDFGDIEQPLYQKDFQKNVVELTDLLYQQGFKQIAYLDLTRKDIGVSVVRAIIPTMKDGVYLKAKQPRKKRVLLGEEAPLRRTQKGAPIHLHQQLKTGDKHASIVVFLGPSLPLIEAKKILPEATYLPPAQCGDIIKAALNEPKMIILIDGFFEQTAAVWHKEILFALEKNIAVYGASSMGALRAAELSDLGMQGVGGIFNDFYADLLEDDDEVAVAHLPAEQHYRSMTVPMVNVRATIHYALKEKIINPLQANTIQQTAKKIFFKQRTWPSIFERCAQQDINVFKQWIISHGEIDQKARDAIEILTLLAKQKPNHHKEYSYPQTTLFLKLKDEILCSPEISLPAYPHADPRLLSLFTFAVKTISRLRLLKKTNYNPQEIEHIKHHLSLLFNLNKTQPHPESTTVLLSLSKMIAITLSHLKKISLTPTTLFEQHMANNIQRLLSIDNKKTFQEWQKTNNVDLPTLLNVYFVCQHIYRQSLELFLT
jgi:YcaO-like protein with predicted kinase domain